MAKTTPIEFMNQVRAETRRVVWPTRRETIMTAVMAGLLLRVERLTRLQIAGIGLGILGVVVIIGPWQGLDLSQSLVAQFAILGATACYGFSLAYMRRFVANTGMSALMFSFLNIGIAAAVLAARPRPMDGRRRRLRSAWELLPEAEPRLAEWAAYFAISAHKRAAAEAGMVRAVSVRDADELLTEAETFVGTVESILGVPGQRTLPVIVPLAG